MRVLLLALFYAVASACAENSANRLTALDEFCDIYYPNQNYPKLTTPQWVGEPGVDAVLVFAIDDMRDYAKYEAYLRPILDRLKQVDGRAPVSIMSCTINPQEAHLQKWLQEGVNLEVHTIDHPCPILDKGDFAAAKSTYDRCVDLFFSVANNHPVGFRTPCMDGINSASPRLYSEIFLGTTTNGNFLTCGSSVGVLFNDEDPELPKELLVDADGKPRFAKHLPPGWVNYIKNYPYPYPAGNRFWELTFSIPDDYQASRVAGDKSQKTISDMEAAIDATVLKKGIWVMTFHPYNWIDNKQVVELIDHSVSKHGKRVKFLNMREVQERIDKNLLAGQPLRRKDGRDNGVRILDLNNDGYLDVVIGNEQFKQTRIWDPKNGVWKTSEFPAEIARSSGLGGVRFGILKKDAYPSIFVSNEKISGSWNFDGAKWGEAKDQLNGLEYEGEKIRTAQAGKDRGVRFRDLDGDGVCELILSNPDQSAIFSWRPEEKKWKKTAGLPKGVSLVTREGRDNGVRFVDFNKDGADDLIFSNAEDYGLWLFVPTEFLGFQKGFSRQVIRGKHGEKPEIPMIVRGGDFPNNGAFFTMDNMWLQNEDTGKFTNLLEKVSYSELLNGLQQPAKSPQEALASIEVASDLEVELVASEPLIEDPVNFDWGADGTLWVVEMHDYPTGVNGKGAGIIKRLKDKNGDGIYDEAVVFLDKLNFPNGVIPWRNGIIYSAAPEIVYAEDTDGDGHADKKEVLFTGFVQGNQQHRINGFELGLDNWIYGANGDSGGDIVSKKTGKRVNIRGRDIRFNPDSGELQTASGGTQFGRRHDDWGNWFGGANYTWGWNYYLQEHYLTRNPNLAVRSTYQPYATDPDAGTVFPIARVQQRFNDVGMAGHVTSACSFAPYRDDVFGGDFQNSIFISEPAHNLVHREVLTPDGVSFKSHRAENERNREFLASRDAWFRPTTIKTGPDGALYIADMYRLVIEHPEWIPGDVQKRMDLRAGEDKGRIYRIKPKDKTLPRFRPLDKLSTTELAAALDSPNGWQRDTIQRLILEKHDKAAVDPLRRVFAKSDSPKTRLQALCTLDALNGLNSDLLIKGLGDANPAVREHAIRLSEAVLRNNNSNAEDPLITALLSKANDPEIRVRYQLAFSLGEWNNPKAAETLAHLVITDNESDPVVTAVLSSSSKHPDILLERVLASAPRNSEKLVQTLTRQVAQNDKSLDTFVQKVLAGSEDDNTKVQILSALLENSSSSLKLDSPQWEAFFEKARKLAADSGASASLRKSALQLLGRESAKLNEDIKLIASVISPGNPTDLQQSAINRLGNLKTPAVSEEVLRQFAQASPQIRTTILALLLKREEWSSELLRQVESGGLTAGDLGPAVQQQLLSHSSARLRSRAEKIFAAKPSTSARDRIVLDYIEQVRPLTGNAEHGRTLFEANCGTCHKAGTYGLGAGPNLAMLYDRGPEQILTAIMDPNRAVEAKYRNYTIDLKNGEQLSGILLNESGNSVTLMTITGTEQPVLRRDISSMKTDNRSMMPEGFEQILKAQDLSDLVAFIHSTSVPPRAFPGNNPAVVRADRENVLHLTADKAEIYGRNIAFEAQYKNLGLWNSESDRAVWTVELPQGGKYQVWLDFACHSDTAGNKFLLEAGNMRLNAAVPSTGTWDDYAQKEFGEIQLPPGRQRLVIRAAPGLLGHLMDLREALLLPLGARPVFASAKKPE